MFKLSRNLFWNLLQNQTKNLLIATKNISLKIYQGVQINSHLKLHGELVNVDECVVGGWTYLLVSCMQLLQRSIICVNILLDIFYWIKLTAKNIKSFSDFVNTFDVYVVLSLIMLETMQVLQRPLLYKGCHSLSQKIFSE